MKNQKSKALTNAQKALKRHQLLAKEEGNNRKGGSFEERFDKFAKWKSGLGK